MSSVPLAPRWGISDAPGGRPTALVRHDEPALRMLVRATLDQADYTVAEACDGDEGRRAHAGEHPYLILLAPHDARPKRERRPVRLRAAPGHCGAARDHAHGARTGLRPPGHEPRRRRPPPSPSRSARSGSPPWSRKPSARERHPRQAAHQRQRSPHAAVRPDLRWHALRDQRSAQCRVGAAPLRAGHRRLDGAMQALVLSLQTSSRFGDHPRECDSSGGGRATSTAFPRRW